MSRNGNLRKMLFSTLSVTSVFIALNLVRWFIMELGAYLSKFDGYVIWSMSHIKATSDHWSWIQVMWLYFAPYIALLFLFAIIKWMRKHPSSIPPWLQLIQSWTFLILIVYVFFMPLVDVLTKKEIYHALNWFGIERIWQIIFGILMFLFFIYKAFNTSLQWQLVALFLVQYFNWILSCVKNICNFYSILIGVIPINNLVIFEY